jgi:hypothetical protein
MPNLCGQSSSVGLVHRAETRGLLRENPVSYRQSTRSNVGEDESTDELSSFMADIVRGYTQTFASLVDTAERLTDVVYMNDPRIGAATSGDIVRNLPHALYRAARQLNEEWLAARDRMGERFDMSPWSRRHAAHRSTAETFHEPAASTQSERRILAAARSFMARSAQKGVTLAGLMKHLRAATPYVDSELKSALDRNFTVVDDDLVYDVVPSSEAPIQSIEEHLCALGYTDLRRDVAIDPRDPTSKRAELVAFQNGVPAILVSLVPLGQTDDPIAVERASFHAKLLSHGGGAARYVLLTDRRTNRYLDVQTSCLVAELPKATSTAV